MLETKLHSKQYKLKLCNSFREDVLESIRGFNLTIIFLKAVVVAVVTSLIFRKLDDSDEKEDRHSAYLAPDEQPATTNSPDLALKGENMHSYTCVY